jgi:hypothetical protein
MKVVELSQPDGEVVDSCMQKMIQLAVVVMRGHRDCDLSVVAARASLVAQQIHRLVAGDAENPSGAHSKFWPCFPEGNPQLLEEVRDVLGPQPVLIADASGDSMKVG